MLSIGSKIYIAMRLLDLELENWGRHEKLKIDLSAGLQIEGRNGTGKSSILEAIRFIFSESSRGYSSRIRWGADHARVKLRLTKDKDAYSIERKIYPKKASSAMLWINRNPAADNPASVCRRLESVLTEDFLDNLVYVPQGTLTDLVSRLRVKGGRQELDRLFGLDKLDKVYRGISDEVKKKEAEAEFLALEAGRYPADAEKEYDKEIGRIEAERKAVETRADECQRNQKITASKIEQLKKKIEGIWQVKKRKEDLEKKEQDLRLRSSGLAKDLEAAKKAFDSIRERKKEIDRLVSLEKELFRYVPIHEQLLLLRDLERRLGDLGDIDAKKRIYDEVETVLNNKYGLEVENEANEERIRKLAGEREAARRQIVEQKNYVKELTSLDGRAKCPRCGQGLTSGHVAEEKKIAEDRVHKLDKRMREASSELLSAQAKAAALRKALDDLRNKEMENRQRKEEIEGGVKDRETLYSGLEKTRKRLTEEGYKAEPLNVVEEKIKELRMAEGRINVYREEVSREDRLGKDLAELEKNTTDALAHEAALHAELSKLSCDDRLLSDLQAKKEEYMKQDASLSMDAQRLKAESDRALMLAGEIAARKKEFLELAEKRRAIEKEASLMKEARDIFHADKGIVKYLREKYIKQLSLLLTRHFRRINQNPKYKDIAFDKDYALSIKSTEGDFTLDQLSGGEKVQLAIALRITLLEMLSPIRLLILDEPFGSLDREHRDVLGEALNRMAGEGQLIIVTHIPVDTLQLPKLELGGY